MGEGPAALRWDGAMIATTPRLLLRTFRADDLPRYAALNAHPAVCESLGGEPLSRDDSDRIAAWAQRLHAAEGIGLLAVERRRDGAFIGMCGLHHLQSYPDEVEVAWRLAPEYWGHGYATEAAAAWLDVGFDRFGFPRIISITDEANVRSLAVMRRLGMSFDHAAVVVEDGDEFEAVVYSLTAEKWAAARACAADQSVNADEGPPAVQPMGPRPDDLGF